VGQVSIEEAARRLGRHPAHVRRLVREGALAGAKGGGRWLGSDDAVHLRGRLQPPAGRPLSPSMAWALLDAVDVGLRAEGDIHGGPGIRELADRRARHRVRRMLADAPPPDRWAAWLRRRARPQRMWVHPGVVERLRADPRLHLGAEAAAAEMGVGAGVGAEPVFYLHESDFDAVLRRYRGRPDPEGQLLFMVIPDDVATYLRPGSGEVAPAVALVDLLNSADARQRHRAAELLEAAALRIQASSLRP